MRKFELASFGIQNTLEVLTFGVKLSVLIYKLRDGIQLTEDLPAFIDAGTAALPAIQDFDLIDDEVLDLSVEEEKQIDDHLVALLDGLDFVVDDVKAAAKDFINAAILASRGTLRLAKKPSEEN